MKRCILYNNLPTNCGLSNLYNSSNKYLVDFELGGRNEETLLKIYNRISNNYKKKCYYVDNLQTITKLLTDNN